MYRIKHFDLATVALYSFAMTLIIGLIILIPVGLFLSAMGDLAQESMPGTDMFPFAQYGILFFIAIAFVYSIFATIIYTIIALLYNLLSLKLGGIKINVEKIAAAPVIEQQVEGLPEG
jgi:hypothetical protein